MKPPSSIKSLLLVSSLFTPLLHAQDAAVKVREIEQKVLQKQYQDAVHALVGSAQEAGGRDIDASSRLVGKQLLWLAKVDAQIDPDVKTTAADQQEMTENAVTLNDLAWSMVTSPDAGKRHPDIALKLADIAIELGGEDEDLKPKVLDTKARTLFILGKHAEAITEQEKAVAAATEATVAHEKAGMEATLASYRKNELPEISSPADESDLVKATMRIKELQDRIVTLRKRVENLPKANSGPANGEAVRAAREIQDRMNELAELKQKVRRTEGTGNIQRIIDKLNDIIIPAIDFEDVSLEEAVEFLRKKSIELDTTESDPVLKGLNFVVRPRTSGTDPRIKSLHVRNLPISQALKYICDATGSRYKVDDSAVTLVSQSSLNEELFTRTFSVPLDFTSILAPSPEADSGAADPLAKKSSGAQRPPVRVPVQELLKANGILFGEGSSASLASGGTLIVTNTPLELDKLEQLILATIPSPVPAAPVDPVVFGAAYFTNKLEKIVIPSVAFEDATLEEVVDFLRKQSIELDTEERDPGKKGLNFVIRRAAAGPAGAAGSAPNADPAAIRIKDLRLRNAPIAIVLKYICDAAGLGYRVDDFSVTLLDPSVLDKEIFTRAFRVPPQFLAMLESASSKANSVAGDPADQKTRPSVTELLKSNGVKFDEGSSAALNFTQLLVTNTASELEKVEILVQLLITIPPDQWERAKELLAPAEPSVR